MKHSKKWKRIYSILKLKHFFMIAWGVKTNVVDKCKKRIHIENKKLSQILSYIHSLYLSLSLFSLKNTLPPLCPSFHLQIILWKIKKYFNMMMSDNIENGKLKKCFIKWSSKLR